MRYTITLTPRAAKELRALARSDQERLARRIEGLALNPRPYGVRKLAGENNLYRIRIGDFRVVYAIEDRRLVVMVIRIGHRREVAR